MADIPAPIKKLTQEFFSKAVSKFVDFIITKYTGKSIKVFEAEGDVEADKVKTKWEVIEKPFWLQAETIKMTRQYTNMGNTLLKATPSITASENKISEENDLFWGLLEHSKEISGTEMQELIAKIIAGEYNNPGTYSMSTLQTVKMLGKKELELFERVGSLIVFKDQIPQDLFSDIKDFLNEISIDFGSFQSLQNLGLFLPNDMTTTIQNPDRKKFDLEYFGEHILFTPANESVHKIELPNHYGLSDIGKQIFVHLKPKKNAPYLRWLKENYRIKGYDIVK